MYAKNIKIENEHDLDSRRLRKIYLLPNILKQLVVVYRWL
jgi:hypothetical protein